ncbi:MAG: DUF4334 domain-containing protein [Chloroflexota bacterium]
MENTLIDMQLVNDTRLTEKEALNLYDQLDPVDIPFMLGRWKGAGVRTNHPMDGLLEATGWYGKLFISENNVHPLLFKGRGNTLFSINPHFIPMGLLYLNLPKHSALKYLVHLSRPFYQTKKSTARLRMVEFRGKVSAAMCYDNKPINDCFRRLDENRVLAIMDFKLKNQPYIFILERDNSMMKVAIKE